MLARRAGERNPEDSALLGREVPKRTQRERAASAGLALVEVGVQTAANRGRGKDGAT